MAVDAGTVAGLLSAALTLGLAIWILLLDLESRLHRSFALLLWLDGFFQACLALSQRYDDLAGRLFVYLAIALPFAAVHFGAALRARHGPRRPARRSTGALRSAFLLLGALALEVGYFLDHGLNRTATTFGPYQLFGSLTLLTEAAIAYVLASDAVKSASPGRRRSLVLVSAGFVLEPLYRATFEVVNVVTELARADPSSPNFVLVDQVGHLLPLAVAVGTVVLVRRRLAGREARGYLGAATVSAALGLAVGVTIGLLPADQHRHYVVLLALVRGLTTLALPAVVGYALLRHHLFDIDLKVKSTLRQSLAGTVLFLTFFFASNSLQFLFPASDLATAIAVAGIVALALWPAERLAKRLVDRWMPGVHASPGYLEGKRADLYHSALEQAFSDGNVTARERRLLERLRQDLGLTEQEASAMERTVRPFAA